MEPLKYQTPQPVVGAAPAALIALPTVAVVATMVSFVHHINEPFGVFSVKDAVIQLGSPLLAAAMWASCAVIARRKRLPRSVVAPWVLVAVVHLTFAFMGGMAYLSNPWNQ